jgi:adenylate cyclase
MMSGIDAREQLLERLREAGQSDEDIEAAAREGRLPTLAVELALGGAGRYSLTHVAREAGLSAQFLRQALQATGRASPAPRERSLTDEDIELARLLKRFVDAGLPRAELLEVARVLSQGIAPVAEAVRRLVGDALLVPGDSEYTVGLRYTQAVDQLAPLVPSLLDHQFRVHLRDDIRGVLVTEAERESGRLEGSRVVTIAFADLVDYTRLGERLAPEDLGGIARRLNELAMEAIRRPVRLVKTIGDAAMFMSTDVEPMVDTVVALRDAVEAQDSGMPSLRVGIAHGPATSRGGDWFGSTVNLASRVTGQAKPGRVLATEPVAEASDRYDWQRRRRRGFKGVEGRVRLFSLDPGDKPKRKGK